MGPSLSLAIAHRFATEGFVISAVARNAVTLDTFRPALPDTASYRSAVADVADTEALQQAIADCVQNNGAITVLVYNVAQMVVSPLAELSPQDLRKSLAVNVEGAFASAHCVLPSMMASRSGSLLFTGGGLALSPALNLGGLAVGKAAIRTLALTFAKELRPFDIHAATVTICGTIQPGTFFSPDAIAEIYWQLHAELPSEFRDEVIYREGGGE
jgi:NAD(P)-dependent dehydrogenase (short-subunit alcohol dehydrogenase family)